MLMAEVIQSHASLTHTSFINASGSPFPCTMSSLHLFFHFSHSAIVTQIDNLNETSINKYGRFN